MIRASHLLRSLICPRRLGAPVLECLRFVAASNWCPLVVPICDSLYALASFAEPLCARCCCDRVRTRQWEMFCTVDTESAFHVCLGPAQEQALEVALVDNGEALLDAFASIDVRTAKASPDDTAMIMGAIRELPGGAAGLNKLAMGQMRRWALEKVGQMVSARRDGGGRASQAKGALGELTQLGRFLHKLGETDAARRLYEEVIEGYTAQLGGSHTDTLHAKSLLAELGS